MIPIGGKGMGKSVNLGTLNERLTDKLTKGSVRIIKKGVKYYMSQTNRLYEEHLLIPIFKAGLATEIYGVSKVAYNRIVRKCLA